MVIRWTSIVWVALAVAGASDAACNAILGNQEHELALATHDASAATDAQVDTFDAPAERQPPDSQEDGNVVQDGQGIPTDAAPDAISSDVPSGSDAIAMSDSGAETDGNVDDAGDGAAADASEASTTAPDTGAADASEASTTTPDTGADKCSAYTTSTPVANGTYAIESNAGFYLDDPSAGGSGTGLDQWAYTGTNQQWTVTLVSSGQYKILAQNGLALTAGSDTGVQATLTTYTGATTQLWTFTTNGLGYNIVNVASCLALDDEGGGTSLPIAVDATTFSSTAATNHYWTLTTSSSLTGPIATGTYEFLDSAAYALDDESNGGAGTTVGQWPGEGTSQVWTVTLVSGVQYKIIGDGGVALTASAGNGQLPTLSAYTGATSQLWVFVPHGSSYYVINVGFYVALDDAGGGKGLACNKEPWSTTSASEVWSIGAAPQAACSQTSVTTNTYSNSNGYVTWKNTGSVAEVNPAITFGVPGGATLNTSGCALGDQTVPASITAVSCVQNGAGGSVYYAFLGSLAAGSSITVHYTTQNSSEAPAPTISVTATSCH
jgi:hypothetical protein